MNESKPESSTQEKTSGRFHSNRRPRRKKKMQSPRKKKVYRNFSPLSDSYKDILKTPLKDGSYIVFDIETTGGNPEKNGITEISALRYKDEKVTDKFYSMVNPQVPIPPIVRKMTGITNKMVKDEPLIDEVMPKFVEFIGDGVLVSHNTIGDLKFLVYFAKHAANFDLENLFLCTHLLTEKLISDSPDKSLKGLAKHLGFEIGNIHRAEDDALITLDLFNELLARMSSQSYKTIGDGIRLQGDLESGMRLGWAVPMNTLAKVPKHSGIYTLIDQLGRPIFVGSAFNLQQELRKLEHYPSLPKQLLRVVLQTYRVEWESHPNIFASMVAEGLVFEKYQFKFSSHQWHLRSPQMLLIDQEEGGDLRVKLGRIGRDTLNAFGLVRDRKQAQQFLEDLAQVFAVDKPNQRHGFVISSKYYQVICEFLEDQMQSRVDDVKQQVDSWVNRLFQRTKRKQALAELELLKKLMLIDGLSGLGSIQNLSGVIVASGKGMEQQIYSVMQGVPELETTVKDWRAWLASSKKGNKLMERLRQSTKTELSVPVGNRSECISAVVWVALVNKGRGSGCHFFDLAAIEQEIK